MLCSWVGFFLPSKPLVLGCIVFFSPTLHKQTQPLAAGLMPALRVCGGVSAIRAALPSHPGLPPAETPPDLRTRFCPRQARREGCYRIFWEGLGAGPAGMRGQRAAELLPADALPHGSAAALHQGSLHGPFSGGSRLWGLSGASLPG